MRPLLCRPIRPCAVCGEKILKTDHAGYIEGDLVHAECLEGIPRRSPTEQAEVRTFTRPDEQIEDAA